MLTQILEVYGVVALVMVVLYLPAFGLVLVKRQEVHPIAAVISYVFCVILWPLSLHRILSVVVDGRQEKER
jgi:hypothetical protein